MKEAEIRYNQLLLCKAGLNQDQLGSQVVYLQSLTVLSYQEACRVVEQGSLSYSLPHQALPLLSKELPLQLDIIGPILWEGTWSHWQIFLVCVLFPNLVNRGIKTFFSPPFVCTASQTLSLRTSNVPRTRGLQFTQEKLGLSTWTKQ